MGRVSICSPCAGLSWDCSQVKWLWWQKPTDTSWPVTAKRPQSLLTDRHGQLEITRHTIPKAPGWVQGWQLMAKPPPPHCFWTRTLCGAGADPQLTILLLQPSECWNYRCGPPLLSVPFLTSIHGNLRSFRWNHMELVIAISFKTENLMHMVEFNACQVH